MSVTTGNGQATRAPSRAYVAAHEEGRPGPAEAFRLARRWFLEGRRLDMQALAAELGTSRASLYRWTGPREQLLGDVVWSLAVPTFDAAKRDARGTGVERILDVFDRFVGAIVAAPAMRQFLEADAEVALRVLTSRGGGVQGRMVEAQAELLVEERDQGNIRLRLEPEVLAYAIVRLTEGFIYNDALIAVEPDLDTARAVIGLLLD
jgi:AcrR family transcriptional regulator